MPVVAQQQHEARAAHEAELSRVQNLLDWHLWAHGSTSLTPEGMRQLAAEFGTHPVSLSWVVDVGVFSSQPRYAVHGATIRMAMGFLEFAYGPEKAASLRRELGAEAIEVEREVLQTTLSVVDLAMQCAAMEIPADRLGELEERASARLQMLVGGGW